MEKAMKIVYFVLVAILLVVPSLYFFGAKEDWTRLYGFETKTTVEPLTYASYTNRTFQKTFTEDYAKSFFLRKTFLKTALEIWDVVNLRMFHHGYSSSIMDGRYGILYEKPYLRFHLQSDRSSDTSKYESVIKTLKQLDEFCRSIGADFVFMPMADKPQAYPEFLPRWIDWFFEYSNYDAQGKMAQLCRKNGIKSFDASNYILSKKSEWKEWVYPPGGTHFNAYGMGLIYEGFADYAATNLENNLRFNRFLGVHRIDKVWKDDDDISNLMNIWYNPILWNNPHFAPDFDSCEIANKGSAIVMGDCYRVQIGRIFKDAKLFDPKRIVRSKRKGQQAEDFVKIIGDLKLVILTYQTYNSDGLDQREEEIKSIFAAMREAREQLASGEKL